MATLTCVLRFPLRAIENVAHLFLLHQSPKQLRDRLAPVGDAFPADMEANVSHSGRRIVAYSPPG